MKTVFGLFLIGLICLIPSSFINAQTATPKETWDLSLALSLVQQAELPIRIKRADGGEE